MNERDEKRRQAYLHGYVDGKGGRSYARDYGKVIADTMGAVDRAYHTGYSAGEYARQAEKEREDDELPQLPEHSDSSYSIRIPGRGNMGRYQGGPVLIVGAEGYPPWSEETFASVLLVLSAPAVEEAALLHTAAAAGYAIEPRVVGEPWQDTGRLR